MRQTAQGFNNLQQSGHARKWLVSVREASACLEGFEMLMYGWCHGPLRPPSTGVYVEACT